MKWVKKLDAKSNKEAIFVDDAKNIIQVWTKTAAVGTIMW
jgi:hypothetical protein